MIEISKTITDGCLVTQRKNKIIRASRYSKHVGVFQAERFQRINTLDGKVVEVKYPQGIVTFGFAEIREKL